jgi:hypothetical protein
MTTSDPILDISYRTPYRVLSALRPRGSYTLGVQCTCTRCNVEHAHVLHLAYLPPRSYIIVTDHVDAHVYRTYPVVPRK